MTILIMLGAVTAFMGYQATFVRLTYQFAKLLPPTDKTRIDYEEFKRSFGEDGNVLVLGIQEENLYQLEKFNAWYDLGNTIKAIEGVDTVVSVASIYNVKKNEKDKKFSLKPVVRSKPRSQEEVDSLKEIITSLPFYDGLLYNKSTGASLMAITLDKNTISTKKLVSINKEIKGIVNDFSEINGIKVHSSGLPYIRIAIRELIASELLMFIFLAALITSIILFLFFWSFKVVIFSMLVVAIGVVWSLGFIALFDFEITILTGMIPSLLIVIGITNCIYLLNKYHNEYKTHGNKIKALARVIQKVGSATLMTNATTAAGFATFIITGADFLKEFGTIASINIMLVFVLSILLIPIIFSYLPPPEARYTKHLDNRLIRSFIDRLVHIVNSNRKVVYLVTVLLLVSGIGGMINMKTTGNIVDDLPKNDPVIVDLKFFEKNFGGVMPFEIVIDTKKKRGVMNISNLNKIDKLQDLLAEYSEFSEPVSLVEAVKFSKQAFYNGNNNKYSLPSSQEKNFILPYVSTEMQEKNFLRSFIDSTKQKTRVSVQMADIGTIEMQKIKDELQPKIDSLFNPEKYNVILTGTSVVFLKGTTYLVKNLFISLTLAIILISVFMSIMFYSFRMVLVSLIPNLIPLILTAAIMGYFGISIKPSTILVFSIAFGISVDNTIHFLAKYRQELKLMNGNIKDSVNAALSEVGVSMIYTSGVLLFGFGIFIASKFGGTEALGLLVSITLLIAVLANLLLLPSMLMTLEKSITTKAFKEPLIEIFDEEEDIDLNKLEVNKNTDY
ncbi:MAG: MMPL family transporter [Bacteroidota bacterium]